MSTLRNYHEMSDSSGDEDVYIPLAQRLTGFLPRDVSSKALVSPVKGNEDCFQKCFRDKTKSYDKFDDELPGNLIQNGRVGIPKHSAHSMSCSDSDDSLPNIVVPKSVNLKSRNATNDNKKKRLEEKKKLSQGKKFEREEQKKLKELQAKRKRIEREQTRALSEKECLKVCASTEII